MNNSKREWDDLLEGLDQNVDSKPSTPVSENPIKKEKKPSGTTQTSNTYQRPNNTYRAPQRTNQTDQNKIKTIFIVSVIAVAIFIFLLSKPGGIGGGSKTLASGSGYKVTGVVRINGNNATIDGTLKVDQAGAYQVNVSIYSKSGQYLGSNNKIFYLGAGDSASVYFHISNFMGGGTPEKYSVSVTKG